jgi:hypothetical protein
MKPGRLAQVLYRASTRDLVSGYLPCGPHRSALADVRQEIHAESGAVAPTFQDSSAYGDWGTAEHLGTRVGSDPRAPEGGDSRLLRKITFCRFAGPPILAVE